MLQVAQNVEGIRTILERLLARPAACAAGEQAAPVHLVNNLVSPAFGHENDGWPMPLQAGSQLASNTEAGLGVPPGTPALSPCHMPCRTGMAA